MSMSTEFGSIPDADPFANLETGFPEVTLPITDSASGGSARFLPSRLPWCWLTQADSLGGSALAVGLIVHRNRARTTPYGWPNRVGLESGEPLGLGRKAVRNGLARLAEAGLIEIESHAGRKAVARIVELPSPDGKPRFILPKIPLDWIGKAARAAAPGLLVGLAAWRYDHMTREPGVARFRIDPLEGSTRSTSSLLRGLLALEKVGLIERLAAPQGFARLRIQKRL